jgi:hypothetical protein
MAQGIQVNVEQSSVTLDLAISEKQLAAGLRKTIIAAEPVSKPEVPKPTGPQVIHIFGLDEGPREIVIR